MGHKYFLWGGERWRELDSSSGAVAGWSRRARFVVVRRGRLRVASRRRVLAALRAHAASLPSAVGLGPRLSVLTKEPEPAHREEAPPRAPPPPLEHHHCCMFSHRCQNNFFKVCNHNMPAIVNNVATPNDWATRNDVDAAGHGDAPGANDAGVAPPPCFATSTQLDAANHAPLSINITPPQDKRAPAPHTVPGGRRLHHSRAPALDALLRKHSNPIKRPRSSTSDGEDTDRASGRPSKRRRSDGTRTLETGTKVERGAPPETKSDKITRKRGVVHDSDSGTDAVCKELTISETDVAALRSYVARTRQGALQRFDADDAYRRLLFYAINPLVDVERCRRTERALRERRPLALPPFAARLGLAPAGSLVAPAPRSRARPAVAYRERSSSAGTDKENNNTPASRKKRESSGKKVLLRTKSNAEESDSSDRDDFVKSRDRKQNVALRQSTASNRAAAKRSESEDESNLFQNSRKIKSTPRSDNRKSAMHKSSDRKQDHLRKNAAVAVEVSTSEESDSTFETDSKHRNHRRSENRRQRPNTARKSESSTDSSESDHNSKTFKKSGNIHRPRASHNKQQKDVRIRNIKASSTESSDDSDSDEKSNALRRNKDKRAHSGNRRESLRNKAPKSDTDHSKSDDKIKVVRKSGGKGRNLNTRTVKENKSSSDDSKSDTNREAHKSTKDDTDSDKKSDVKRALSGNRRESLRNKAPKPDTNSKSEDKIRELRKPGDKEQNSNTRTVNQNKSSTDDSDNDANREAIQQNDRKRDSTRVPNDRKRESLRHKTTSKVKNSENDEKSENVKNNVRQRDSSQVSSDNRRESLRHRTANNIDSYTRNTESNKNNEIVEANMRNRDASNNKRDSSRHNPPNKANSETDDSENEGDVTSKINDKKKPSRPSSNSRWEPPRDRSVTQSKSSSKDPDPNLGTNKQSHKKKESNDASSDRKSISRPKHNALNSENSQNPSHNKRASLRRRSKSNVENSDSDKRQFSHSSKEQKQRTVSVRVEKYVADSDSSTQEKTRSKSLESPSKVQHGKAAQNGTSGSRDTGALKLTKTVKDLPLQTKTSKNKIHPPSKNKQQVAPAAGPSKATHTISKRASSGKLKEYSNLEDHAIVAWVSSGGRARRVNGNALWRELQDTYQRLTGHGRSWHSLRNRYLRYILPSLGELHLPPADVSRLRAAAAAGEIKRKRAGLSAPRRNSIFDQTAVQAASSRSRSKTGSSRSPPPSPPSPPTAGGGAKPDRRRSSEEGEGGGNKRRSLRSYFGAPHQYDDRPASPSASPSARDREPAHPQPAHAQSQRPRHRKLFNPKLVQ